MTLIGFGAKNVLRNKTRLILTVLGLAVAVMTFVTLTTALRSWSKAQDVARRDRLVTRQKISFILPLPKRYAAEVRAFDQIAATTWASWFGGKDPRHEREFFATYAVDPETYFSVYDEVRVPPEQLDAFKRDRSSALVGELLAAKLGWRVGDRVTLQSDIYPSPEDQPWTFTIAGLYGASSRAVDRSVFLLHWNRLNDALPPDQQNQVGWIASRTVDPSRTAEIAAGIDRAFDERDVQTLSQDERSFTTGFIGMISSVLDVVAVLSGAILLIMALILANAIGMNVRERVREHGALKALGFSAHHVVQLVLIESGLIAVAGAAAGLALAYLLVDRGMGEFFEANLAWLFPVFRVDAVILLAGFGVSVALSLCAATIPALAAGRVSATEALRRIA